MVRAVRLDRAVRFRGRLAVGSAGAGNQESRRGEYVDDAAAIPAANYQQRLRAAGLDAGRVTLVRRAPTAHADHRDDSRPAFGQRDRQQWTAGRRLVRRHRRDRLSLAAARVRSRPRAISPLVTTANSNAGQDGGYVPGRGGDKRKAGGRLRPPANAQHARRDESRDYESEV